MSNLSQFFSGGGPVKISRATTAYSYNLSSLGTQIVNPPDIDTGVTASPVDRAFITQEQRGDVGWIQDFRVFPDARSYYITPMCAAYIGSGNEVKIGCGGIAYSNSNGGDSVTFTGRVMWWLVQYD
jgi:hypothetical protein